MKTEEIASLLVAGMQQSVSGNSDLGWHTGVIQSWDDTSGVNSVLINDNSFTNLRVLSTGAVQPFQVGDVVGIIRVGTQYFILGKVRAPGAGAGERIASSRVNALVTQAGTAGGWVDLTSFGPSVTLYVGSSRRVLVLHSCEIAVSRAGGYQGVQVTGASSIAPETAITDAYLTYNNLDSVSIGQSVTATTLVTAGNGLQQGQNTFTCKYKVDVAAGGTGAQFNNRVLTVIPF